MSWDRDRVADFGGIAGRVVIDVLSSPWTVVGGFALAFVLVVGNWLLLRFRWGAFSTAFTQLVLSVAYARAAVWPLPDARGAARAFRGGAWAEVPAVAGRYMLMSLLWIAPLLRLGLKPSEGLSTLRAVVERVPLGADWDVAVLYWVGMALTPPVFLVVCVGARTPLDLISPSHWRGLFGGRLGDLGQVYVLYLGSVVALLLFSVPLLIAVGGRNPSLELGLGGLLLVLFCGPAVTVPGRLCAPYIFGDVGEDDPTPSPPLEIPSALTAAPVAEAPPTPASSAPASKLPLLGGVARIETAWRAFEQDPEAAISALEELRATYAPDPHVLQALCLMLERAEHREEAVETACTALPLCLERGHVALAADIFRALCTELPRLDLDREDLLAIGTSLLKSADLRDAANILVVVLLEDTADSRAVKGLLQVADLSLRPGGAPEDAGRIYQFLLDHCPDSPFVDDMRRGLAEVERRAAQATR